MIGDLVGLYKYLFNLIHDIPEYICRAMREIQTGTDFS